MVYRKNKSKLYFSTIIFVIVALFSASLFSFGVNSLKEKTNAAAGSYTYVFHMDSLHWKGDSTKTIKMVYTSLVGDGTRVFAFSPNDQAYNIIKPYKFLGWANTENGTTVTFEDGFELSRPSATFQKNLTFHYYAVWRKLPYDSSVTTANNPGKINSPVSTVNSKISIKYTDIDTDDDAIYGGNKEVNITLGAKLYKDTSDDRELTFYKDELGWDISQEVGTSGKTWYLAKTMFMNESSYTVYNDGLPVLRSFVVWETLKFSIKYKHTNGQTYTVDVGSIQIPQRDDTFYNNFESWITASNNENKKDGKWFTVYIYGWTFGIINASSSGATVSYDDGGTGESLSSFITEIPTLEYNQYANTIYFSYECAPEAQIENVFKKAYVTFEQPENVTTGKNIGAFWGTKNASNIFVPEKNSTGTAKPLSFTVYDGTSLEYNYQTKEFKFSICKKVNGTVQNIDQYIYYQIEDGYSRQTLKLKPSSGTEKNLNYTSLTDEKLTGEVSVTLTYSLVYYDLSVGYTVEGNSKNTNAATKSAVYLPNGAGGDSYQDVTFKYLSSNSKFSVEGYELPTKEAELKTIFGEDYDALLGKGANAKKRIFNGWLLDVTALEYLGYVHVSSASGVETWKNGSNWVKFNVGNRITTLNGSRSIYLSLTKVSGFGNFVFGASNDTWGTNGKGFAAESFVLPIVPNWSAEYNVQVQNSIENRTDANNNSVQVKGVIDNNSTTLKNKVDFIVDCTTSIDFVYSNGTAFDSIEDAIYSSLYDTEGEYGLYRYGYEISGYQITFKYNGTTFYACYCDALNSNGVKMGVSWYPVYYLGGKYVINMYDSLGNATTYTPVLPKINNIPSPTTPVDVLKDTNLWVLIENFSTWTQGDFVLQDTTFVMTPEWKAATVKLSEATGNDFKDLNKYDSITVTYDKKYNIDRGNCVGAGKTIAYYITNSGSIVAADYTSSMWTHEKVKWDYLNLKDYTFDTKDGSYNLTLRKVEIDNLYMVELDASTNKLDLDSSADYIIADESISTSLPTAPNSTYNTGYRSIWAYYTVEYQSSKCVEVYTKQLDTTVNLYIDGINVTDQNLEQARSFFKMRYLLESKNSQGEVTSRYVIIANNHPIGNLAFSKPYYVNIATMFNGTNGAYAFTTDKYDPTFTPHTDYLMVDETGPKLKANYIKSMTNYPWTIDMDNLHIGEKPTLYPLFYREAYLLDVDYAYKVGNYRYNGFVGYLDISVVDNAAESEITGGNGRYLVYYNSTTNTTKIYKYSNNANSAEYNAATLSKWVSNLTEDKVVGNITIYRGCSINVNVFDQSQINDINLTNTFYDALIGYRFAGEAEATVGQNSQESLSNIAYTFEFNTNTNVGELTKLTGLLTEPVDLTVGDAVSLTFLFEPINYDTTVALTDQNAGQMHIARPGSSLIVSERPQKLNNLQRGSTASIFYYAFAGYGLKDNDFTINENLIESLDMLGNPISRTTDEEKQTYKLNISGAWLRMYLYKNGEYSASAAQTIGQIDINIDYLEFDVYARIYDKYETEIETKAITSGWKISQPNINWQLPVSALETYGGGTAYAYYRSANQRYYALLNSWANQPRTQPSSRDLFAETYDFLLNMAPTNQYTITTDNLYSMVLTTAGIIVPEDNRTFYFDLEVAEIYKLNLSILVGVNDTNCSTRTLTISNSENNTVSLNAENGYIQSNDLPYIYTYRGLESAIIATYDDKYYTGAALQALDLPSTEDSTTYSINSPLLANCDKTIFASFTPVQLPVDLTFNYNGTKVVQNPTSSAEDQALISQFFNDWQMKTISGEMNDLPNSTETGKVVAFDMINFIYSLKNVYNLTISVNGSSSRLVYDAQTSSYNVVVSTDDYLQSKVQIVVDVVDKKQGQITLEIGKDNSNEASFYTSDDSIMYQFADLWINGINYGKSGSFMVGYSLKIKLNTIAPGYEFVGIKKDQGSINTDYTLSGNEIVITDGKLPDNVYEDDFVTSISGKYYAVFKKTLFKTELVLTGLPDSLRNNYGYSIGGRTAVWRDGHLAVSKGSAVGDTLTLFRNSDLPYEKFVRYYYIDKSGNEQTISNSKLTISSEIFENIKDTNADGSKLLKVYVETGLKYNLTFIVDQDSLQYLNKIEVNGVALSSVTNTFTTNYFETGSVLSYTISSLLPDKYTIVVSGDATGTGQSIENEMTLTANRSINVKITKNSYGLQVEEKLYADIIQLNNNSPETLTGNDVINPNINGNKVDYVYNSNTTYVDILANSGEGENKKQLTSINFEDENLSFALTLNTDSDIFISTISAKNADGSEIDKANIKLVQDKTNANLFKLSITADGKTYTFTFEKTATSAIQFGFVGLGNAKLTLTYTIFKLISIS